MLGYDEQGNFFRRGTLHQSRADAGDLKRLYLRPEAAGHRLGRRLVDDRIEAADKFHSCNSM